MKKYIAKTNVSINVVLASGANRHVSFSPLTGGSSVFYTDDPDLIQAMERHYKFGTLFRVDTTYVAEKLRSKPAAKPKPIIIAEQPAVAAPDTAPSPTPTVEEVATAPEAPESEDAATESEQPTAEETDDQAEEDSSDEVTEETDEESAESEYKTIAVSDPDSAKSYLAEHFGYSRTKIKTIKAIKEAGAAHGIVFEGI
ncbi:hypothetical protein [Muribaculum intestinale]|jgi:hypothetical protein|uniref:hypothetical protein n=1 Tax=Muribaculum intestinale TaxID=1796646 RepID=UPI0025B40F10|nr:hypothetical protein [Muribaculum intestinale]